MNSLDMMYELKNEVVKLNDKIDKVIKQSESEKCASKFNFDAFNKGKLVVNCKSEHDADIFLAYLAGKGFTWWRSRYSPIGKNNWDDNKELTGYIGDNLTLTYCDVTDYFYRRIIQFNPNMLT